MDIYSQLEYLRQKSKSYNKIIIAMVVVFVLTCTVVPMLLMVAVNKQGDTMDEGAVGAIPIIAAFAGVIFMVVMMAAACRKGKYNKEFQSLYKDNFLVGLLRQQFPDVQYNWQQGFNRDAVAAVGLVQMGNRYYSEDFICGTYDGVFFEQSDVTIKNVVRSGKHTHTYTHFKGRMFTFNYDMKDISSTLIFSRDFGYKGRGFKCPYEDVKVESIDFNKLFKIQSARAVDAFYILTPHMMECIYNLERYLGNIALHFTPGKVHVAFNSSTNAFNANIDQPLDFNMETQKRMQEMQIIIDIIKALRISEQNR